MRSWCITSGSRESGDHGERRRGALSSTEPGRSSVPCLVHSHRADTARHLDEIQRIRRSRSLTLTTIRTGCSPLLHRHAGPTGAGSNVFLHRRHRHPNPSDVKFHDFFAPKYFMKYFWNISKISRRWTTDNIDQNAPNTNKQIARYTVLVVLNRFYYSARQKSL